MVQKKEAIIAAQRITMQEYQNAILELHSAIVSENPAHNLLKALEDFDSFSNSPRLPSFNKFIPINSPAGIVGKPKTFGL